MSDVTLIIDNYDSFVYNIVQIVGSLGSRPLVVRNDEITVDGIRRMGPDRIVISPGPGTPERREDVGISEDVVRELGHEIPILGICMGHQVIGHAFGARISRARRIVHGKRSPVLVKRRSRIFEGVPGRFMATRYHSLVLRDVAKPLVVTAVSEDDGEVMSVEHEDAPIFGVQFHPESIATEYGPRILGNFVEVTARVDR
ncbi:MAG: anthranilate synthase component II [Conexivisphaera sp.]